MHISWRQFELSFGISLLGVSAGFAVDLFLQFAADALAERFVAGKHETQNTWTACLSANMIPLLDAKSPVWNWKPG